MKHTLAIAFLCAAAAVASGRSADGGAAGPQPCLFFMPAEWVQAGFPAVLDRTQPITDMTPWMQFNGGIIDRGASRKLVLPRDFEMVAFLLEQFSGRDDSFDNFVSLPHWFAGTSCEEPAKALLRPLLKKRGSDLCVNALAAFGLARMNDQTAVWDMLSVLSCADGVSARLLRKSIRELGHEPPPETDQPAD